MLPKPVKRFFYWSSALKVLKTLCAKSTVRDDAAWEAILKGSVYHGNKELGVEESVM